MNSSIRHEDSLGLKIRHRSAHIAAVIGTLYFTICIVLTEAVAQVPGYAYTEVSTKGNLFRLVTGGLGSFVMFFMGLGGAAAFFLTRKGHRGEGVSLPGVAMLLIAIGIFGLRIMIQAGMLGHEYIEYH